MYRHMIAALMAGMLAVLVCSCAKDMRYRSFDGGVWATTFHIVYNSDKNLDDSIRTVMKSVEESMSPFLTTSLVSAINRGETSQVDSLFKRIFLTSAMVHKASGGAFDPTVAPLVNLWGFGYKDGMERPSVVAIDSALMLVGFGECRIEADSIVKKGASTEFDFSSITKGCGCDMVGDMLRRNGCVDFMVEIGGEIALSGQNPRGEKWHIMIDSPVEDVNAASRNGMAIVALTDCGVATSGNYRNYRDVDGKRIGHTINPLTGYPMETNTLSATVVARNAMEADALATACMAMEADAALAMVETVVGAESMLVVDDGNGCWTVMSTTGFPELY